MKNNSIIAVGVVVLICSIIFASIFGIALKFCHSAEGVVDRTIDPDNVIYNYEYFKQAYNDILAMDQKIITAQNQLDSFEKSLGPRKEWDFRDKEEDARLSSIVTGLKNTRADMVATYNARAKMVNRNIFKQDVPDHID